MTSSDLQGLYQVERPELERDLMEFIDQLIASALLERAQ